MNESIVIVKDLVKRYGELIAVNHISFDVRQGEVFGLLGPNGAGKTSTLECIEGIRGLDEGSITIAGIDVQREESALRKILGVQLQISSLPDYIRASEAMELVCTWHSLSVRTDLIKMFGFEEDNKKQYRQMSTGQKRRLHLALALAVNPKVIILDEPTAGIDVEGRAKLHEIIREFRAKGTTFLLATHDMAEAEMLCDRIAIIIKGRLITLGTPAQVTAAGNQATKITVKTVKNSLPKQDTSFARFLGEKDGYCVWVSDHVSKAVFGLLQTIENIGDSVADLRVERPTLEERFLEIVGGEEHN